MKSTILQVTHGLKRAGTTMLWAALLCAALQAKADTPTYYWDMNGADDGPGNPPDGDWYENTPCWTLDPYGTSDTFYYSNRANIIFAATGDAYWYETSDYTVTVHGIAQVSDIVFKDGNCTLTTVAPYYLDKDTPFIYVPNPGQTATMNSVIVSMAGTSNGITLCGPGTLVLGRPNTYLGATTNEGGKLQLGAPQVLPGTSTLVLAGGDTRTTGYAYGYSGMSPTLATGGYSQTLGPLLLTGPYNSQGYQSYTIDFGGGASALAFADSHLQNWNGIPLTIVNYVPGASLRFGTNSAGLTATQLGLIHFANFLGLPGKIDAQGFVTPAYPTLSIVASGTNNVKLTWNALNGRNYNIQYKTSPNDAYWMTNSITDVVAKTNTASFIDTFGTNKHRVYRIQLRPVQIGS
jgi:autotransporter-associated beta strand protein